MRSRRVSVTNGIVDRRIRLSPRTVLLAAMGVVGLWLTGAFLQEVSLNQSLSRQAADLRSRNAALAAANQGYSRDIQAVSSGAAAEETARMAGYARSDEQLYIVTTPSPSPSPRLVAQRSPDGPLQAIWHFLTGG